MKMLLDADSDRILGFTMLGADAGEVLAVVQTAMLAGLPYTGLREGMEGRTSHLRGHSGGVSVRPVFSTPSTAGAGAARFYVHR